MFFPGDVDDILIGRVELVILRAEFLPKLLGEIYLRSCSKSISATPAL